MTIDPAFLELMPSTVTSYGVASRDAYGKATYAASGTTLTCRIQRNSRQTRDNEGKEVLEIGQVFVYGTTTISTGDKLVLDDGEVVQILSVETVNDEDGPHHTVIRFGSA